MELKEEWRAVLGFEGRYEVSNQGRVRGLLSNYNGREKTVIKSRILKFGENRGYCRVVLLDDEGKRYSKSVHRLVAFAFLGDCTDLEINHKDGNKKNNNVDNSVLGLCLGLFFPKANSFNYLFRDRTLRARGGLHGLFSDCLVDI